MNENLKTNKNYVIAIGRQFGCGGREVGQRVAQLLDINYFDKEFSLKEVAERNPFNMLSMMGGFFFFDKGDE